MASSLLQVTCMRDLITVQSSRPTPIHHPHWSLFSNHQLNPVSRSQTALSGMQHLTCGTRKNFLQLFVFLISSILHHQHTQLKDNRLTFLLAFFTLVLKLSFLKVFPYEHSFFGSHWRSILVSANAAWSQPSWLLVRTFILTRHLAIGRRPNCRCGASRLEQPSTLGDSTAHEIYFFHGLVFHEFQYFMVYHVECAL